MKVGDYVRTKYGVIAKITDILENCSIDCDRDIYYENGLKDNMPMMEIPYNIKDEYIIKSAEGTLKGLLSLIEVGDYVNGYKVLNVLDFNDNTRMLSLEKIYGSEITEVDIKSIVTKEQFESMEYKIESEVN